MGWLGKSLTLKWFDSKRHKLRTLTLFGLPEGGAYPWAQPGARAFPDTCVTEPDSSQLPANHTCHMLHTSCMLPGPSFSETPITCTMLWRDGIQPLHGPDCTLSHWQETNDPQVTQSIAIPPFPIWVLPSLKKVWSRRSDPART